MKYSEFELMPSYTIMLYIVLFLLGDNLLFPLPHMCGIRGVAP